MKEKKDTEIIHEPKSSRMDLRLTHAQRQNYERAASLKGQTLSQWSITHLDKDAINDIEQESILRLRQKDFEEFCEAVNKPMAKATAELIKRPKIWS